MKKNDDRKQHEQHGARLLGRDDGAIAEERDREVGQQGHRKRCQCRAQRIDGLALKQQAAHDIDDDYQNDTLPPHLGEPIGRRYGAIDARAE
jgi:hypothetical protein